MDALVEGMLRAITRQYMTDTCVLYRSRIAPNEYGITSATWEQVSDELPCRVMPETRQDNTGMVAGREAGTTLYQVALPFDTDVRDGDRIEWNGAMHECLQVFAPFSNNMDRRVMMVKVS